MALLVAFRKTGLIELIIGALYPELHGMHALAPWVQYAIITWTVAATTLVFGNVLAASAGAPFVARFPACLQRVA